ncbi:MAG: DUF3667 domain-containing protein [Marinilabiliaceae bacterium]|nr:DUF3667 domain-containing protein [Marinilabiliaceae bacterium]
MKHLLLNIAFLSLFHKFNFFKFFGRKQTNETHFSENEPCYNCGAILENRYCPNCGQDRLAGLPRTFKQMASAFFTIIFYDKAWNTVIKLLFKPGFLSTEYVARRIAPYTQPFKMFWVMLLAFTIVFSLEDGTTIKVIKRDDNKILQKSNEKIEGKTDDIEQILTIDISELVSKNNDSKNIISETVTEEENILPEKETEESGIIDYSQYFPYFMLLIIPIFAALLKLFFRKEKYAFSLHLIFTIHLHTFFFFLITLNRTINLTLASAFSDNDLYLKLNSLIIFLTIIIYSISAAIKFYSNRKKFSVIFRMFLIGLFYFIAFFIVLLLIILAIGLLFGFKEIQI